MGHFKKPLKKLFNWTFYKVKSIILSTHAQVVQAVYYALPKWVFLQQQKIFFHQLHFIILLFEDQFPKKIQADLLQSTLNQLVSLSFVKIIKQLPCCLEIVVPIPFAKCAVANFSKLFLQFERTILGILVQEIDGEIFSFANFLQWEDG